MKKGVVIFITALIIIILAIGGLKLFLGQYQQIPNNKNTQNDNCIKLLNYVKKSRLDLPLNAYSSSPAYLLPNPHFEFKSAISDLGADYIFTQDFKSPAKKGDYQNCENELSKQKKFKEVTNKTDAKQWTSPK
jgi:hypothetical protein